jgi:transcriptional regulator with XRE-family HTH domain
MRKPKATNLFVTVRKRSGLTMRELSDLTGVKRSTLCDWLRFPSTMRASSMVEIANALGMTDEEWLALRKGGKQ